MVAELVEAPIRSERLLAEVSDARHGAQAIFLGAVRNHHAGRAVRQVRYEAFRPLAEKVLAEIVRGAEGRWPVRVAAVHRLGELQIGELSVGIAVGSAHRAEAFEACRHVIEEIKRRLPVWKKETYADGASAWLDGCGLLAEAASSTKG